jgi:hypothetical protein
MTNTIQLIVVATQGKANETSIKLQQALIERGIIFASSESGHKIIDQEFNSFVIKVVPITIETPLIKGLQVDGLDISDLERVFMEKMADLRADVRKRNPEGFQDILPALVEFNF